ncbi:MAG: leucine-rich repeat domain-containing protein, partial [Alistipes sp.]|nr:leucine-rich repeat domain-containing protein [Alistipes sp.]
MLRKLFIIALCLVATTFTTQAQTQTPPDNEIWYTTTDGKIAELQYGEWHAPENGEDFEIVSHTYENGSGVIRANKPIKAYGDWDHECVNRDCSVGFWLGGNIESVILPKGLTIIGEWAFDDCKSLTSITIPDSVTTIGKWAFARCSSLTSITIPDSVTTIGVEAFSGCSSLPVIDNIRYADTYLVEVVDKSQASYTIKEGTRIIGSHAFSDCSDLTSITIPDSVTTIGSGAFEGCSSLTNITISDNVTQIEGYVYNNGLIDVDVHVADLAKY